MARQQSDGTSGLVGSVNIMSDLSSLTGFILTWVYTVHDRTGIVRYLTSRRHRAIITVCSAVYDHSSGVLSIIQRSCPQIVSVAAYLAS